jgi:hypothetical protein
MENWRKAEYMDFCWTEEQFKYKMAVIEFAQKGLRKELIDRDRQGQLVLESNMIIKEATASTMGSESDLKTRSVDG